MKKILILAMAAVMMFGTSSCNKASKMRYVVELSTLDIVKELAAERADETFNRAVETVNTQKSQGDTTAALTLFYNAITGIDPNVNLSVYFAGRLQGVDNGNVSNEVVIKSLQHQIDEACSKTVEILKNRFKDKKVKKVERIGNTDRIVVEFSKYYDDQLDYLLQTRGELEFWATYSIKDEYTQDEYNRIYDMLIKTDSLCASKIYGNSKDTGSDAHPLLSLAVSARGLHPDPKVREYIDYNTRAPEIMFVRKTDTARVNSYIREGISANIIDPKEVKFLWSYRPHRHDSDVFILYAIKVEDYNKKTGLPKAKLEGNFVTDASQDFDQGGNQISMTMNSDAASICKDVTRDNVNKCIAIVIDDEVYVAPNVNDEISGGRSSISGDFTPEEAENISTILRCGPLPASLKIIEKVDLRKEK